MRQEESATWSGFISYVGRLAGHLDKCETLASIDNEELETRMPSW